MPTYRTQAPSTEPVTLAEAKLHLRVDHADEDALIAALISAAREQAEHRCGRSCIDQQWTLKLDAFPSAIRLYYPRVTSVTSISYIDPQGVTQTLAPQDYVLDNASEYVAWVVPAAGAAWPDTAPDRVNAVTVVYRAGESSAAAVPASVKAWILLTVGVLYEQRAGGVERAIAELPHCFYDGLLDPYRAPGCY